MSSHSIPDEVLIETVKVYRGHNNNQRATAIDLGVARSTVQDRLKRASEIGLIDRCPVMPGFKINKVSSALDSSGNLKGETVRQVPDEEQPDFNLRDKFVLGKVTSHVKDGKVVQEWVRSHPDDIVPDLVAALKEVFKEHEGRSTLETPPTFSREDLLTIYPIADQHLGMLSWGRETNDPYDIKIASDRLRSCTAALVSMASPSKYGIILNLGDWTHTDDQKNMTPRAGNILDVDSRYFKILTSGVQLMKDIVDLALQKHEFVIIRNIPGNHDPHAAIALTVAMAAFYSNNPRVIVDDDPGDFFFHRFGNSLIGAAHGHKLQPQRMAMTMAVQRREDWGATKFHYFYFGHIHHDTVKEVGDVRCESFRTIAGRDAFAHGGGYDAAKTLVCITLHRENGEQGRHYVNVPALPSRPQKGWTPERDAQEAA